jgi:small subunit ribosomal protein S18
MKIDKSELRHTNLHFLQQFVGGNGEILSRRVTGLSAKDQRKVAKLIKRARHMGLVPTVGGWSVKESGIYLLGKTQASMQEGVGGGGGLGEDDSGLGN